MWVYCSCGLCVLLPLIYNNGILFNMVNWCCVYTRVLQCRRNHHCKLHYVASASSSLQPQVAAKPTPISTYLRLRPPPWHCWLSASFGWNRTTECVQTSRSVQMETTTIPTTTTTTTTRATMTTTCITQINVAAFLHAALRQSDDTGDINSFGISHSISVTFGFTLRQEIKGLHVHTLWSSMSVFFCWSHKCEFPFSHVTKSLLSIVRV